MLTKQQLESMSDVELAVRCGKIVDNPSAFPQEVVDNACDLKTEWVKLQTRPEPDYKKQQQMEARRADLKARMAAFLWNYGA